MEMSASGPYGPNMGMRSDSVIRLGTWPTKSLALVDGDDPVAVELSSEVPDLAAAFAAVEREEGVGADSCISGITMVGEAPIAAAAAALGLRCCGCRVAGDLGDLVAVTADERDDMEGNTSLSGRIPGVVLVEP